jgi:hypothetical protein
VVFVNCDKFDVETVWIVEVLMLLGLGLSRADKRVWFTLIGGGGREILGLPPRYGESGVFKDGDVVGGGLLFSLGKFMLLLGKEGINVVLGGGKGIGIGKGAGIKLGFV